VNVENWKLKVEISIEFNFQIGHYWKSTINNVKRKKMPILFDERTIVKQQREKYYIKLKPVKQGLWITKKKKEMRKLFYFDL